MNSSINLNFERVIMSIHDTCCAKLMTHEHPYGHYNVQKIHYVDSMCNFDFLCKSGMLNINLLHVNWFNPGYICVHVPSQGLDFQRHMSSSFLVFRDKR